jgi:hypothetical protein
VQYNFIFFGGGANFGALGPYRYNWGPMRPFGFWEVTFSFGHGGGRRPPSDRLGVRPCSQGKPGQAAVCLRITYLRGYSSAVRVPGTVRNTTVVIGRQSRILAYYARVPRAKVKHAGWCTKSRSAVALFKIPVSKAGL